MNAVLVEFTNLAYHSQRAHDRGFNLTIREELSERTGAVMAAPQDLGRVFLNLATNACQATAARARAGAPDYEPELVLKTERNSDAVLVRVRDNGGGVAPEVRTRMFEPFFTTKAGDAGTGLGLSISNDIVRAHGGELSVDSVEGEFTEFTVAPTRRIARGVTLEPGTETTNDVSGYRGRKHAPYVQITCSPPAAGMNRDNAWRDNTARARACR